MAALMIQDLGIRSVNLITNNPKKIRDLRGLGIAVTERTSIEVPPRPENFNYLSTKVKRMDHLLQLGGRLQFLEDNV